MTFFTTPEFWSIVASVVSVVLGGGAIFLSIYFFVQNRGTEKSVSNSLTKIETQAEMLQLRRLEPLWFRLSFCNELSLLVILCYNNTMRNVRRYFKEGRIYFLTHVTYLRQPILITHIDLLWNSIHKFKQLTPYELIAWVILPDHWHCIIDPLDNDVASLMKRMKLSFAAGYLKGRGFRSGRTWHNRYWDHVIRDQEDMNQHLDYIHYNPVKHGLVTSAIEYPHSSFRQFVDNGLYDVTWGIVNSPMIIGDFGE